MMSENDARAAYDVALERYTEASSRLASGDETPGLEDEVQRLYSVSMEAYSALLTASEAPAQDTTDVFSGVFDEVEAEAEAEAEADEIEGPLADTVAEFDFSDAPQTVPDSVDPQIAAATPVLGRRQGLRRFSPPVEDAKVDQPLRKDVLTALRTEKRSEIGRERKIAGNLPEWDPLPPSEILPAVKR